MTSVFRVCVGTPGAGEPRGSAAFGTPCITLCTACRLQVDGKKYPSLEDGIQVVVMDGRQGRVVSQARFRTAILQGIPWQLFNYVLAIPDK